jgi:hypothetical protein
MSMLADMILERLSDGGVLARADFPLDATYDSIGRTLGELVKARKIVRVTRGRYRIAN